MSIENILDQIDEMIDKAWGMPLSGGKCLIEADRLRDMLDDIRGNMPSEIRQAKSIVSDRADIISTAKAEAEDIVRAAEERARALVMQEEVVKQAQQKGKLLALQRILWQQSDANHPLSAAALIELLAAQGIAAERKSIYDDIEVLCQHGMDIERVAGPGGGYYLASRDFELPELRLLVDAVQSSRFITEKKSLQLISKLERLAGRHEGADLQRQVVVTHRIKTMNESIYYNVDSLHAAIARDMQISFEYFDWTVKKQKKLRHGGERYRVSPWALLWDNENYYLIAYDDVQQGVRHYRVDKMLHIEQLEQKRMGREQMQQFDVASYAGQCFGMFGGAAERVTMRFDNSLAGVVIDRFGTDAAMIDDGDGTFRLIATVAVSPVFLAWVMSFGDRARILSPESAVRQLRELVEQISKIY